MNKERLYFAYGSNINLVQMANRCPDATALMPVVLPGYELVYRAGGVATVIPREGSEVHGLLWSITPECEKSLDRYEGYPSFYHKTDVTVTDPKTGKNYVVMMYEMDQRYKGPSMPSAPYFECIMQGYIENRMDISPLIHSLQNIGYEMKAECKRKFRTVYRTYKPQEKNKPKNRGYDR